ncbi:glycosyltransferase [Alloalcanivorax venustensis]|uniref:glycosyltransferase n=1 Tax=Alloalcanivorax venustensis TaxID=172371 RepID=UPI001891C7DF|nr:glycosyltransferase [Alloalcanivorax venustensis]
MQETIVHVISSTQLGGLERRLEMLSENSGKSSYTHVFISVGGVALKKSSACRHSSVFFVSSGRPYTYRLMTVLRLFLLFRKISPLAVHAHGVHAMIHSMPAALLSGVDTRIAEFIGMEKTSKKIRFLLRMILFLSTTMLGISRSVADYLRAEFPIHEKKIGYIYNPVYLRSMPGEPLSSDVFRICVIARLEPVKNVGALIEAFARFSLSVKSSELWIIGSGSLESKIREMVIKRGLEKNVTLFGSLRNPTSRLSQSSVYVQPSLTEAFGIAIAEAMLCGIPVVVPANAGVADFIQDGINGWVVPDVSVETLTHHLHQAHACWPDRLQSMGRRAKTQAQLSFSIESYIRKLDDLYTHGALRTVDF